MSIKVLLADDHQMMRDGLRAIFEQVPCIEIIGEVGFFLDQPRYGTFKAVEDGTETVQFTLENYRQLAKAEPTIAEHLHVYIVEMTTSCIKRQAHEINLLLAPARGIEKEKSHSLS